MPPPVAFSSRSRSYLLRKDRAQRAAGYEPLEGDVQWTPRSTLLYPALCTFAGLCAGVFGVGGGIVKVTIPHILDVPARSQWSWPVKACCCPAKRAMVRDQQLLSCSALPAMLLSCIASLPAGLERPAVPKAAAAVCRPSPTAETLRPV